MNDWQAAVDWLNGNSGFVMAVLTGVYVVCTVALCIFAWRSNSLAKRLYEAENRPVVICDFFVQNTCLYFRIKNIGRATAADIRLAAKGPAPQLLDDWKKHPAVEKGIACLPQGAERVSFFCGPGHQDLLKTVEFTVKYADASRQRSFEEQHEHNLEAWMKEDLARQNNAPLIHELRKVTKALDALAKHE
jgi:hypothetical protein